MRLRTQAEAYAAIVAADADTAITRYALRQMILSGVIPCVTVGRKRLIDLDKLPEYLAGERPAQPHSTGVVRRIEE